MIALVLSSAWPRYYASSPFLNLLQGAHPRFSVIGALPHETTDERFRFKVNQCEALVVDDVLSTYMDFYTGGPKLMVGGDPHCHNAKQVERITKEYNSVDYVLTGAVFSRKLSPPYLYPDESLRAKHVYFPHMVPDGPPPAYPWEGRHKTALLSGSMDKAVYPFRWECRELSQKGAPITLLPQNDFQHEAYFEKLGTYQSAITCNSNFEYTVAKYFEIPWCGAILLAPPLGTKEEAELIGFVHKENALFPLSPEGAARWAEDINKDPEARAMASAGAKLMRNHHTTYQRLDYIDRLVTLIKAGGFRPEDAKDCFLKHRQGVRHVGSA